MNKIDITQIYDGLTIGFQKLEVSIEYMYTEIKNGTSSPQQIIIFENICEAALQIIDTQRELLSKVETYVQEALNQRLNEKEMQIRDALVEVVNNSRK